MAKERKGKVKKYNGGLSSEQGRVDYPRRVLGEEYSAEVSPTDNNKEEGDSAEFAPMDSNKEKYSAEVASTDNNKEKYSAEVALADSNKEEYSVEVAPKDRYMGEYSAEVAPTDRYMEEYSAEVAPMGRVEGSRVDGDQGDTAGDRESPGKTVGYVGVGLGIASLFIWSIILGPIAAIMGSYAYSQGNRTSGAWAIGLGLVATLSYFFLIPFTR